MVLRSLTKADTLIGTGGTRGLDILHIVWIVDVFHGVRGAAFVKDTQVGYLMPSQPVSHALLAI